MLILLLISFFMTSCLSTMKMLVFFLAKCVWTAVKTMVVDRKNQKALALLKPCANRVHNRTDKANLNFSPNFFLLNWTFRLPPKRQLSILLNLFFPLTLTCVVSACFATMRVNIRFRAKNTGFSTRLYPVYATSYW